MHPKEQLIEWLGDAYAMEKGLCDTLKRHADEAGDHPDLQGAIPQHLQETERHASELENALKSLDESTSAIKTGLARAGGLFGGLSTMAAADTMVKNALSEYATEHFEIACYRSLIAAAKELGETSTTT